MANRHFHFIGETKIEPINFCGKNIGWILSSKDGLFIPPSEIQPTKGEHDFTTCEGCQKSLAVFTERLTEKFEGNNERMAFPFCCPYHSNLVKVIEFNRALFTNAPEMVAKKIVYTNQHIINNHGSENWYKEITDYIEWVVESFGQMPIDCGEPLYLSDYFFYVSDLLERDRRVGAEKKARLLEFLSAYRDPTGSPKIDLNILYSTYEKWFKLFPFEISFFQDLKPYYEDCLFFVKGKPETNIYSGMAKAKLHTKSSLVEVLVDITDSLLTQINGVTLYENGLITDASKIKLELIISSRKLKLKQGYKNSSPNEEQRYRKILKDWFKDEKKFFDEIIPLLKAAPPQQIETKTDKLKAELGKYGFFELPKVKQLSELGKQSLIELVSTNGLPYSIAMFDFLDFLKHIESQYFKTKGKLNKEIARWFNSDEEGRAVKGNISSLSDYSTENKGRYTAHTHKENVKKDYLKLK
jgi:hypothetical protein